MIEYILVFLCGLILGYSFRSKSRCIHRSVNNKIRNSIDYMAEADRRRSMGLPYSEYIDYCNEEIDKVNKILNERP